jgi:hypothetical protein
MADPPPSVLWTPGRAPLLSPWGVAPASSTRVNKMPADDDLLRAAREHSGGRWDGQ